jgi:hypothetical protein
VRDVLVAALFVAPAAGSGQAPVAPEAAIAAAQAAMADTARGASLRVVLLTVGQGEFVWERFGHNLLWIRDERTGESVTWNWGLFRFDEPGFYRRFLFGNTRYWMAGEDPVSTFAVYQRLGREIVAQELALSPGQRAALDALVRVTALEEYKFYRYDYFIDNCSTRLRDALDIVLGGALRAALDVPPRDTITYRSESLRLVQHSTWLVLGMDLALGAPADRPLTAWQAGFVPMRLRDAVRSVTVAGPDGTPVPLVAREYVALPAAREPDREALAVAPHAKPVVITVLVLVTLLVTLSALARRRVRSARTALVATGMIIHLTFGFLSSALVFMALFTRHEFWDWNPHLLLFTPISLAVAALLPRAARGVRFTWVGYYHVVVTGVALAVAVGLLVQYRAGLTPGAGLLMVWAHVSWVLHLALLATLAGRSGLDGDEPPPEAAAMRMAA